MDLDDLLAIAKSHEGAGNHRLAAAIVKKRMVLGVGINRKKTHPLQAKFSRNPKSICLHAEIDAIKNALRHFSVDDLIGSTIMVARVKKSGERGNATPCAGCQRALIHFGIRKVIHT